MRYMAPPYGSKTRRKRDRQSVRNTLGTSSDDPPSLAAVVRAAQRLGILMRDTSGDLYTVQVVRRDGKEIEPDELRDNAHAWREA